MRFACGRKTVGPGAAEPTDRPSAADPTDRPSAAEARAGRHERRRLGLALLVSLFLHALLLGLTFGEQGLGLPGIGLPWQARRTDVPELRVVLLPMRGETPVPAPP